MTKIEDTHTKTDDKSYEDFSEHAKLLLVKRIPKNTIRASHSHINKLSV